MYKRVTTERTVQKQSLPVLLRKNPRKYLLVADLLRNCYSSRLQWISVVRCMSYISSKWRQKKARFC